MLTSYDISLKKKHDSTLNVVEARSTNVKHFRDLMRSWIELRI